MKIKYCMNRPMYEIIPSPLYGWNFKNAESRHVIKYSREKKELINYAISFCKSHSSELVIYNYLLQKEKVLNFEANNLPGNKESVFL